MGLLHLYEGCYISTKLMPAFIRKDVFFPIRSLPVAGSFRYVTLRYFAVGGQGVYQEACLCSEPQ